MQKTTVTSATMASTTDPRPAPDAGAQPNTPVVERRFEDPRGGGLLIAILTCEKHAVRAAGVRNSWLRLAPSSWRVLFVHGRPGQAAAIEGDRLYLDCREAYEYLPHKVLALAQYAKDHLAFDHLFKTDDDTYIDLERFSAFRRDGIDYAGQFREQPVGIAGKTWHYGKCDDARHEVPYEKPFVCPWATGGGYFLSRRAVEALVTRLADTVDDSLFEDMMVGEALTRDPGMVVQRTSFADMGVINPLLPKDMLYVQAMVLERRAMRERITELEVQLAAADATALGGGRAR